jgi:hypothetical protein
MDDLLLQVLLLFIFSSGTARNSWKGGGVTGEQPDRMDDLLLWVLLLFICRLRTAGDSWKGGGTVPPSPQPGPRIVPGPASAGRGSG